MGLAGVVAEIIVLYAVNLHLREAPQGIVGVVLILRCLQVAARDNIPFVVIAVGELAYWSPTVYMSTLVFSRISLV
jgi:hypothetical protein